MTLRHTVPIPPAVPTLNAVKKGEIQAETKADIKAATQAESKAETKAGITSRARAGRIKLRHLQCFLSVLQHGSLQKAAEALSVSQPAASKTLAELEACLDVTLFARGRNGAQPTAAAVTFQRYAAACMVSLQKGVEAASRTDDVAVGRLRVGILPTLVGEWVGDAIQQFVREWPGVALQVVTGRNAALLEGLRDASFDLAIGRIAEPAAMTGLSFEFLRGEPLAVCVGAGHPLLAAGALSGQALAAYRLILPPGGTLIRESANRILASLGLSQAMPSMPSVETLSVSVGRQLARRDDFVWIVPQSAVGRDLEDGILQQLPVPTIGSEEPVGLILPADPALQTATALPAGNGGTTGLRAFAAALRECAARNA